MYEQGFSQCIVYTITKVVIYVFYNLIENCNNYLMV